MYKKGISLLELLVYMALFVTAVILIVFVVVRTGGLYGQDRTDRRLGIAAETAMERIVREIRLACDINSISASSLTLSTFSSFEAADTTTCANSGALAARAIALNGTAIQVGGVSLMPSDIQATGLTFTQLAGGSAPKAIRVQMTLTGGGGSYQVTRTYYATATLRGSY